MIEAHRSAEAMARCLISYIADDRRVRNEVYRTWGTTLQIDTIRDMRRVKAKPAPDYAFEAGWDWRGDREREVMALASGLFLRAIEMERCA